MNTKTTSSGVPRPVIAMAVVAAALGFFVDAYDLLLYSIVRNASLADLGVNGNALLSTGVDLLNAQLLGMLLGGVLWGIVGDIAGRRQVLFGSILTYSAATMANGFVGTVGAYGICRFIAGAGLAGELGVGVTLVAELMSKRNRGYGTMIVAAVGVTGVVTASLVGDRFAWRTAYIIGGCLGLLLLGLRLGVRESLLYKRTRELPVSRGNFFLLFSNPDRLKRYVCLILLAMPIWYAIGILITFSPELSTALGLAKPARAGTAVLVYYIGLTLGDFTNGWLSQLFQTRKKIIGAFMGATTLCSAVYFLFGGISATTFYAICALLGWASGYWAVFVTVAAEQFGTNLRATAAVTAPNFVRGLTALLTIVFRELKPMLGTVNSAMVTGAVVIVCAFIGFTQIKETFGKDLDYIETV